MNKYYGPIGFAVQVEDEHSITEEVIREEWYYGDVRRNSRRYESSDKMLDDLSINNEISILADAYANENFHAIRYAVYMGTKWEVTNVTVEAPRLLLTLGGVYNGPTD